MFGQSLSSSENYVYTRSYLEPVSATNPGARQVQSVQYMDGLHDNWWEVPSETRYL